MAKFAQILALLILCLAQSAFGAAKIVKELPNELIVESSAKYMLGDNDTRIDARNISLNEAKRAASELAGTQVKSELVIENDQILKDQITIVAASFMTIEVIKEAMTTSQEGRSVMEVTIRARLDKSAIRSKFDTYRGDDKRKNELSSIQAENSRLQNELTSLNAELSKIRNAANDGSVSSKPRAELVARRDVVISSLEENQGQVRRVFEKGTLLSMAKKSGDAYQTALDILDKQVIGYIKNNTKIKLGEPEFRDNGNGTYDVLVGVQWSADPNPAINKLKEYFIFKELNSRNKSLVIRDFENINEKQKLPYTENLFVKLMNYKIILRIDVGGKSANLTIASPYSGSFRERSYHWLPSGSGNDQLKVGTWEVKVDDEQNPVVIKNVPENLLREQSAINAQVVLIDHSVREKK